LERLGQLGDYGVELGSLEEAAADVILLEHPDGRAVAPELLVPPPAAALSQDALACPRARVNAGSSVRATPCLASRTAPGLFDSTAGPGAGRASVRVTPLTSSAPCHEHLLDSGSYRAPQVSPLRLPGSPTSSRIVQRQNVGI
jgi:hypothetical protein